MKKLFTSESVTEGHPDKICDRVADEVLDAVLAQDDSARVACEVVATTQYMLIMGEISGRAQVDYQTIARNTIQDIGYTDSALGFDYNNVQVDVRVHTQSPDIARGVQPAGQDEIGAGDQGMMFGYACDETASYMPLSISLAHSLASRLAHVRRQHRRYLRPDGKTQVTVEYEGDRPIRVHTVVLSCQHAVGVDQDRIRYDIIDKVIAPELGRLMDNNTGILINTTGNFVIGGPHGDSGLTGRKIIVDTYGGHCAHGGGAFSGKDATKVDRSAAYMARYICKNIVAAGLARRCRLQLSSAIGRASPISVWVDTQGTGELSDDYLAEIVMQEYDLRPAAIIERLDLCRPIYAQTSAYGHFGKPGLSWEALDMVERLTKL
jgi:S-adenosylmethionine synthetase